jgi:hypothetical protein
MTGVSGGKFGCKRKQLVQKSQIGTGTYPVPILFKDQVLELVKQKKKQDAIQLVKKEFGEKYAEFATLLEYYLKLQDKTNEISELRAQVEDLKTQNLRLKSEEGKGEKCTKEYNKLLKGYNEISSTYKNKCIPFEKKAKETISKLQGLVTKTTEAGIKWQQYAKKLEKEVSEVKVSATRYVKSLETQNSRALQFIKKQQKDITILNSRIISLNKEIGSFRKTYQGVIPVEKTIPLTDFVELGVYKQTEQEIKERDEKFTKELNDLLGVEEEVKKLKEIKPLDQDPDYKKAQELFLGVSDIPLDPEKEFWGQVGFDTEAQLTTGVKPRRPITLPLLSKKENDFELVYGYKLPRYLRCPQLEELSIFSFGDTPNYFIEDTMWLFGGLLAFSTYKPLTDESIYQKDTVTKDTKMGVFRFPIPADLLTKKSLNLKLGKENIFSSSQIAILRTNLIKLLQNASILQDFQKKFYKKSLTGFDVLNRKILKSLVSWAKKFSKKFARQDIASRQAKFTRTLEGVDKASEEKRLLLEIYDAIGQLWEVFQEIFKKISINDKERYFGFISLLFDVGMYQSENPVKNSNVIAYIIAMRNIPHKTFWVTNPGLLIKMNKLRTYHLARQNYDEELMSPSPNFMVSASFMSGSSKMGLLATEDLLGKDAGFEARFNEYKNFLVDARLLEPLYRSYTFSETRLSGQRRVPEYLGFMRRSGLPGSHYGVLDLPDYSQVYRDVDYLRDEQSYLQKTLK